MRAALKLWMCDSECRLQGATRYRTRDEQAMPAAEAEATAAGIRGEDEGTRSARRAVFDELASAARARGPA